jgi:hypothetical protein
MKINVGDFVTWKSFAGQLSGEVINIELADNAANQTVPWLYIKCAHTNTPIRFCAAEANLKALEVEVLSEETV